MRRRNGMSKDHLALVRKCPCCVDRIYTGNVQAHHLMIREHRGVGMKAPDRFVIPLCQPCHEALHQRGSRMHVDLLKLWGIDGERLAAALWFISQTSKDKERALRDMRSAIMQHVQ